jgi:branched-subunit amino acid aminotransferase/4-amino-4-deoxychorismate lyase
MRLPAALANGELIEASQLQISLGDLGFVNGATIAEQMRTFQGRIFELPAHLDRYWAGLELLEVADRFDRSQINDGLQQLVELNRPLLNPEDDLGVCLLATPGGSALYDADNFFGETRDYSPRWVAYTYPLSFERWADHYQRGFDLIRSSIQEVPEACWPKSIKSRSRMHYYLADLEAARLAPGAKPVLTDASGNVRDSTIASLICFDAQRGLLTPGSASQTSVSVQALSRIAAQRNISFTTTEIAYQSLHSFDEIMLATTPWCVAPVRSVDGHQLRNCPGPVFELLMQTWSGEVGVDIRQQAQIYKNRVCKREV